MQEECVFLADGTCQICILALTLSWVWLLRAVPNADTLETQQPQVLQSLEFGRSIRAV